MVKQKKKKLSVQVFTKHVKANEYGAVVIQYSRRVAIEIC